jgi:hypothetical protein
VIRQIRILGLSMLAVVAIGAISSASASASTQSFSICREGGTEKYENHLCGKTAETGKWSFAPVEKAEKYTLEGTGGVSKLEGLIGGTKVVVECKKGKITGEIESEGKTKNLVIVYEECKLFTIVKHVRAATACIVSNITTNKLIGTLVEGSDHGPEDELAPAEGTTLAKVKVAECALESMENVTGKQTCSIPEAVAGLVEHELVCSPSGGALEFGKKPASYYGTTSAKLSNGSAWGTEP